MRISDWSSDVCSSDLTDLVARRLRSGGFGITRQPRYPLAENTAATAAMRAIVPTAHIEPGGRQRRLVTERLEQIVFGHRLDDRHRHLALGERGAVEQGDLIVIELAERAYSAGVQIGIVTGLGSRCEGAGPCMCGGEGGCPHQHGPARNHGVLPVVLSSSRT